MIFSSFYWSTVEVIILRTTLIIRIILILITWCLVTKISISRSSIASIDISLSFILTLISRTKIRKLFSSFSQVRLLTSASLWRPFVISSFPTQIIKQWIEIKFILKRCFDRRFIFFGLFLFPFEINFLKLFFQLLGNVSLLYLTEFFFDIVLRSLSVICEESIDFLCWSKVAFLLYDCTGKVVT